MSKAKSEIADEFRLYADLLRIDGQESRAFAYDTAAEGLRRAKYMPPDPSRINGVGPSIREKIVDLDCGRGIGDLNALKDMYPWYIEFSAVDGLGPTLGQRIYDEFGVETVDGLLDIGERITDAKGIGDATARTILDGARSVQSASPSMQSFSLMHE